MLRILPDLVFPLTPVQVNPLMESVVQLNALEAGLTEQQQRALSLMFHIHDLFVKTKGRIDYRHESGHAKMVQDATTFVNSSLVTKVGEIAACHLAIDFSDSQIRLRDAGHELHPVQVSDLLNRCRKLSDYPVRNQKAFALLLDYLGKRPM